MEGQKVRWKSCQTRGRGMYKLDNSGWRLVSILLKGYSVEERKSEVMVRVSDLWGSSWRSREVDRFIISELSNDFYLISNSFKEKLRNATSNLESKLQNQNAQKPIHPLLNLPANLTNSSKMNRGGGGGGRKVLLPPINFIFKLLQQHSTVQIWLYEQLAIRIEGRIRVRFKWILCYSLSAANVVILGLRRIHEPCYWRCCGSQASNKDEWRE